MLISISRFSDFQWTRRFSPVPKDLLHRLDLLQHLLDGRTGEVGSTEELQGTFLVALYLFDTITTNAARLTLKINACAIFTAQFFRLPIRS
jgi:hypothetical protein